MADLLAEFSRVMAGKVADIGCLIVTLFPNSPAQRSGVLWRPGLLVTFDTSLPQGTTAPIVLAGGIEDTGRLLGRDPATEVALYSVETRSSERPATAEPVVGSMALVISGADYGGPSARLGVVHAVGPSWLSRGGGRIDRLISLDVRLDHWERGGLVLDGASGVLGIAMMTARERVLLIPPATIDQVVDGLLAPVGRSWLGMVLKPVSIPTAWQRSVGHAMGLLVTKVAKAGPAEAAGIQPGDIMLEVNGRKTARRHDLIEVVQSESIGHRLAMWLLRDGMAMNVSLTAEARPITR